MSIGRGAQEEDMQKTLADSRRRLLSPTVIGGIATGKTKKAKAKAKSKPKSNPKSKRQKPKRRK